MQFTYHPLAKDSQLIVDGELHKYLFKVRRHDKNQNLFFRNLEDNYLYQYKVVNISRRETSLVLVNKEEKIIKPSKFLHIFWCVVDHKNIEKMLPSLNEIGVSKITFVYCKYSQKNIKLNYEKLNKILINSSSQSGRSDIIQLDHIDNIEDLFNNYSNLYMFNFSHNHIINHKNNIENIFIGPEGGFCDDEIKQFDSDHIVGVDSNMILRSETAVVSVASMLLL